MKQTAITDAIKAHLADMPDLPATVWENIDAMPAAPFLVVEPIRTPPRVHALTGEHEYTGRVQISVVVEAGRGVAQRDAIAEAITAHFRGATLTADGVTFRIVEQPYIGDGYQDGVHLRTPVQVRYRLIA